jgi:predicted transcriptional regulator
MNTINQILHNNNITPEWFITIKFSSTESFTLSNTDNTLIFKADNQNIFKVEKEVNYFINLLYQSVYNKTSTKKIKETKFQILSFIEQGESKDYHCHLIVEKIKDKSIDELKQILDKIRIKHKGIRTRDTNAIDIIPYDYRHSIYAFKAFTPTYNPLSTTTSRINR